MKPVKNIASTTLYQGICSGFIYTLLHYMPCYETVRDESCTHKSCNSACMAVCEYGDRTPKSRSFFHAQSIEGWRVKK